MKYVFALCATLLSTFVLVAQQPLKLNSSQIHEKIQALNFFGTVLYIAAHPDDENTRLISYLSHKEKARTIYLSLTRGDGGQNLIGPEIRESLGVIRTQELLAARAIDGGEQRFSRANDFGYSKHPDETLQIWNKEAVLSDVVWAIRTLKPDIIINRFDYRTPGSTHGHHTASAMLSVEAFELAADKNKFTEQLVYTTAWKPQRLFFNTSWWFYGSHENFKKADKSNLLSFDVGVYYPEKGYSNNELAAMASSQHLCQGFGRLTTRGSEKEYIELIKGQFPKETTNLFEGMETTWKRVKGGEEILQLLDPISTDFNFSNPSEHLTDLMKAYTLIDALDDTHWKSIKKQQISDIITACAGLYLEATATGASTTPNEMVALKIEAVNRSQASIRLKSFQVKPNNNNYSLDMVLENNKKEILKASTELKAEPFTSPYWLQDLGTLGMYTVHDPLKIGLPNTPRNIKVAFQLEIYGVPFVIEKTVIYRYSKRDKGELYRPFEVLPAVTSELKDKVIVFSKSGEKEVAVTVKAGMDNVTGDVRLIAEDGWEVTPNKFPFSIAKKGGDFRVSFSVKPPKHQSESDIEVAVQVGGKTYTKELVEIAYEHIPKQAILKPSKAKVVRMNIEKKGTNIGYIQGAGDIIPTCLEQIGYKVTVLDPNELTVEQLAAYDAIVLGIRAYNTLEVLKFKQDLLLQYVANGGNMIVQYNTSGRGDVDVRAPYSLEISRDRVTDENANVTFLNPNHALLNKPNKISSEDFDGWVQERGLYFPKKWSKEYVPVLSMHDKGEAAKEGSLLVAKYGKGNYIYTGLSFFRELPAGVPGAYKLFANMLSLDN